jgi:hypothetical protein
MKEAMIFRQAQVRLILGIGFFLLTLLTLLTSGCIPGDGTSMPGNPDGFFWGIWHGWIAPVSLVWGLFNESIRVYEAVNSGWWYDVGFYMAIIGGFGGLSLLRRDKD